jgi:hypothetical protein
MANRENLTVEPAVTVPIFVAVPLDRPPVLQRMSFDVTSTTGEL